MRRSMGSWPSRRRGVVRRQAFMPAGRWSRFRDISSAPADEIANEREVEFVARQLLTRYGVVFRRVLERERIPVAWRDLVRVYRHQELRGEVRGGRFVQRFAGEQYALPEALVLLRRLRRRANGPAKLELVDESSPPRGLRVSSTDPLNLHGILTPDARVPAQARRHVMVG